LAAQRLNSAIERSGSCGASKREEQPDDAKLAGEPTRKFATQNMSSSARRQNRSDGTVSGDWVLALGRKGAERTCS